MNKSRGEILTDALIYEYQKKMAKGSPLLEHSGIYYFWYRGTKDELIAEGIAQEGWFPGEVGNNKTSQRVIFRESLEHGLVMRSRVRAKPNERMITIRLDGECFRVRDDVPKSISEALLREEKSKGASHTHESRTEEEIREFLAKQSASSSLDYILSQTTRHLKEIGFFVERGICHYKPTSASAEAFRKAANNLWNVVASSEMERFDYKWREARDDTAFQAFLNTALNVEDDR